MAPGGAMPGAMLRQRLSENEEGRRIAALIEEHHSEVVHLVNHERAVTVAWHRNKGPLFLNEAAANLSDPRRSIPREIEGVGRETLLQRMAEALIKYGSKGLRESVERFLDEAVSYVNRADSVQEIVDLFGKPHTA
jgi:N-methylhydantoinase B/oxoprolinase/acetone carboxylase alpha subunit